MISLLKKALQILRVHWLAVLLVGIGTWLRFAHLPDQGILFGDSGRELLAAAEAVDQGKVPFQPDSLTLWLEMAIYRLVGYQPNLYYWVFAGIGSVTLVALYEFCLVWLNQRMGLVALTVLSFSPLAIAHSRMVYHTAPLVLWTVLGLWAVAAVWRQISSGKPHKKTIIGGGIGIGLFLLLPVMFEIQNKSGHHPSGNILTHFSHIISLPANVGWQLSIAILVIGSIVWGGWLWWRNGRVITPGKAAVGLVTGLVSLVYIFHSVTSENNLLVYCALFPLLIALSWEELPRWGKWVGISSLVMLSSINLITLHQQHFLVDQTESWSYGPSLGTHRQIITWAAEQTQNSEVLLLSQKQTETKPHAFDAYIWLGRGLQLKAHQSQLLSLRSGSQPYVILDTLTTEPQTPAVVFTTFHGKMPWSKTLYTPSVTARLLP